MKEKLFHHRGIVVVILGAALVSVAGFTGIGTEVICEAAMEQSQ